MATLKINPVSSKLPQLRQQLNGTFFKNVRGYTIGEDGTITLNGTFPETLRGVARVLEAKGLIAKGLHSW
jgi:hypothetical protein